MKHKTVETLPTAGIQAASAANLLIVKDGGADTLISWMSLILGGKPEFRPN